MKNRAGKLGSRQGGNKLIAGLITVLIALTALLVVVLFMVNRDSQHDREYTNTTAELRVLSQQIAKNGTEAASGNASAFDQLSDTRDSFRQLWSNLTKGNSQTGLPASDTAAASQVQQHWDSVRENADIILATRDSVMNMREVTNTLNEIIPQMQVEYEDVSMVLQNSGAPEAQIALARRQSLLAERMFRSVNNVLSGDEDAVTAADRFLTDATQFGRVLNGQLDGNNALAITRVANEDALYGLEAVAELFGFIASNADAVLQASPDLFKVSNAANDIFENSEILLGKLSELATELRDLSAARVISPTLALALLAAVIAIVVLIGLAVYRESQTRLTKTQAQNEQNQNAILRLLDELADLADGDLTAEASVTEDFTGAIADSINYAIDQMRGLVQAIRGTAVRVATAAQESQSTAMQLADASEHQAQEIAGASAAVNEMAISIDQVSSNAAESSAVAERSVAIAKKGTDVVQNTIRGMDNIREQIQETSKRIKRLGESSQEIGDIVSLINDIADQTNILSLNAAIQASMAGDAGRGFAVVADEVQRLAERSSAATKQIEALVKTIQADTNEAVISMEHTTAEVVRGARLAQDAGVALEEIENVSTNLAELIQNISNAARQQSSSASHISNTMNVIQEITSQTSSGTNATAYSIGNLADMAFELRSSVAGFKLPDEDEVTDTNSKVPLVS
ncbi:MULTISPECIES: methyl-accepting chemotaxis protein [unclassified Marinobacter]|jgi:twitching motility protein PilJ|uniref:methyl-accepting chemotaxis protein n=1 Tax=unclassified Marinobacter TaxID=83889 RepID=UPI00200D893C|nr:MULTISPECIES: methyl-accepting chemotaxis protein [unclassified Marinobacter]MCL1477724.1 methyl-accepting chemotaxis protein [Marinobacter sp.]MCL1482225.1 methyl-accepting chemotaxis protein [Marinobacter sp.]MCL1485768.1 methyl-accepting chemotaxis protein [Marinobacter sp.]MCL1489006.1 methyl-accepting chemotaxis protein [Marinobacter sp.]UQG55796.1 methyl-accepting chemotaxis protein [Marinobacter sp. M4C]